MNRRRPENANSIFCLFNEPHNFFLQIEIISEKKGSNIIRLSYDYPEKYLKIYSG